MLTLLNYFSLDKNQHKTKTDSLVLKKVMLETLFQQSTHSNTPKKFIAKGRNDESSYKCSQYYQHHYLRIGFLVSKETVVLRRWERSKQKFGFIKRVDEG